MNKSEYLISVAQKTAYDDTPLSNRVTEVETTLEDVADDVEGLLELAGDSTLDTTAQTLTGAINEVNAAAVALDTNKENKHSRVQIPKNETADITINNYQWGIIFVLSGNTAQNGEIHFVNDGGNIIISPVDAIPTVTITQKDETTITITNNGTNPILVAKYVV